MVFYNQLGISLYDITGTDEIPAYLSISFAKIKIRGVFRKQNVIFTSERALIIAVTFPLGHHQFKHTDY